MPPTAIHAVDDPSRLLWPGARHPHAPSPERMPGPTVASMLASPLPASRMLASLPPSTPASPMLTTQRPIAGSHVRPAMQSALVMHSGTVIVTVEDGGWIMPIEST